MRILSVLLTALKSWTKYLFFVSGLSNSAICCPILWCGNLAVSTFSRKLVIISNCLCIFGRLYTLLKQESWGCFSFFCSTVRYVWAVEILNNVNSSLTISSYLESNYSSKLWYPYLLFSFSMIHFSFKFQNVLIFFDQVSSFWGLNLNMND